MQLDKVEKIKLLGYINNGQEVKKRIIVGAFFPGLNYWEMQVLGVTDKIIYRENDTFTPCDMVLFSIQKERGEINPVEEYRVPVVPTDVLNVCKLLQEIDIPDEYSKTTGEVWDTFLQTTLNSVRSAVESELPNHTQKADELRNRQDLPNIVEL